MYLRTSDEIMIHKLTFLIAFGKLDLLFLHFNLVVFSFSKLRYQYTSETIRGGTPVPTVPATGVRTKKNWNDDVMESVLQDVMSGKSTIYVCKPW